jgi:hypothetical protein
MLAYYANITVGVKSQHGREKDETLFSERFASHRLRSLPGWFHFPCFAPLSKFQKT